MSGGLLPPAAIVLLHDPDVALEYLQARYIAEVDARLRAAGLYRLRPNQCSHTNGLSFEFTTLVQRCHLCGYTVTDEVLHEIDWVRFRARHLYSGIHNTRGGILTTSGSEA